MRDTCDRAEAWGRLRPLQMGPDPPSRALLCEAGPLSGLSRAAHIEHLHDAWYQIGAAERVLVPLRLVPFVLARWPSRLASGRLCGAGSGSDRKASSVTSYGESQPPSIVPSPGVAFPRVVGGNRSHRRTLY